MKKSQNQKGNPGKTHGFTLIEMLVAMTVFVISLTALVGIFVSITQAQRGSTVSEQVAAETRYAMELMVREIQTGAVVYDESSETKLTLERGDQSKVVFQKGAGDLLVMGVNGAEETVLSDKIKVELLKFSYNPPLGETPYENEQPRVTVLLTITQARETTKVEEQAAISVETTVASRKYR